MLAERIRTFKPRVDARNAHLLKYEALSKVEQLQMRVAAEPLGELLRDVGPERDPDERGPDRIDLAQREDNELIEWTWPKEEQKDDEDGENDDDSNSPDDQDDSE